MFQKSQLPPMPKWNWKSELAFWMKSSEKKQPKPIKRTHLPHPTKLIAKMGKKRIERIKNEWSETDMNRKIWNERPHFCEQCWIIIEWAQEPFRWIIDSKWEKVQKLIRPECFAHVLAKWMYPKHRLNPKNIKMVCGKVCHGIIDKIYSDISKRNEFEKTL